MLPRDALVCLVLNGETTNFASVLYRDPKDLAGTNDDDLRPRIGLCLHDEPQAVSKLLSYVKEGRCWQMIQVSNNFFAYEPVLKVLQKKDCIAMADKILDPTSDSKKPQYLKNLNIENLLPKTLNESQREAMELAFSQELAIIQGPPGTGKSFVGEAIIDIIYHHTKQKILIECYTNHALDQFLEGLLDRGIKDIVRIGSRSKSSKLEAMNIKTMAGNIKPIHRRRAANLFQKRDEARSKARELAKSLNNNIMNWENISTFLSIEFPEYYEELQTLKNDSDGFQIVGEDGKPINHLYKWNKWRTGQNISKRLQKRLGISTANGSVWNLNYQQRSAKIKEWAYELNRDKREELSHLMVDLRSIDADLKALHKVNSFIFTLKIFY